MSTVVAVRRNGKVYLASDLLKGRFGLYIEMTSETNLRIRKLKNGILIGSIGYKAQTFRLYLNESWFTPKNGEKFDKKFIVTSIIPKYIARLKKDGALEQGDEDEKTNAPFTSSSFIVVSGQDIFVIDSEFNVTEIDKIAVLGDSLATKFIGEYLEFHDGEEAIPSILNAFCECSKIRKGVGKSIVVVDSESGKFEFYGDKIW